MHRPGERAATPLVVDEPGVGRLELWPLPPTEETLRPLLTELFAEHWQEITFGPLIQGAAWELRATGPPARIAYLDGYLTVDLGGGSHVHLCLGPHRGTPADPTPREVAAVRRTGRAELYRRINRDGTPDSWGLRLRNGRDEPQIDVLLPNPFLTDDTRLRREPDWSRLALWDRLRARWLGLAPDPRDRSGHRFIH